MDTTSVGSRQMGYLWRRADKQLIFKKFLERFIVLIPPADASSISDSSSHGLLLASLRQTITSPEHLKPLHIL